MPPETAPPAGQDRITDSAALRMGRYTVRLDREGAEWLAAEAGDLGRRTKDHGWTEIAESLEQQLAAYDSRWDDDDD